MHKRNIVILLFFSFCLFVFGKNGPKTYIDNGSEGILEIEELEKNITLALNGDQYAAYNIFEHYMSVPMESKKEFLQKTLYWAIIAAENDTYGRNMYTLYSFNKTFNCISDERSFFWLLRSVRLNYKDSLDEIKQLEISTEDMSNVDLSSHKFNFVEYKKYAESGNQYATLSLINYFKNLSDVEQIKYWLCIGAQNGSKECMKEYADLLRKSSNKNDNIRAGFWERKAK